MTGLFRSTQDALLFAFRHAGQSYDRPLMLRMADAARGSGAGLAGLDGAAQAGMIRAEVAALGRLYEAALVARFADRSIPCQCKAACCSGERLNGEWINAVAYLTLGLLHGFLVFVGTTRLIKCLLIILDMVLELILKF